MFVHNVYGKEWKLFFKNEIEGGSCAYWTILFKQFFDKLKNMGLSVESDIFYFPYRKGNDKWRHSGLILSFQGKDYLIELFGTFNIGKDIIKDISELERSFEGKNMSNMFDGFKRDFISFYYKNICKINKNALNVLFFNNVTDLIDEMKESNLKTAIIEFKPTIDGISRDITLEFVNNFKINLFVDNNNYYCFNLDYKNLEKIKGIPDSIFIDKLINNIMSCQFNGKNLGLHDGKLEITKYIQMIRNKINIPELRNIYGL